MKKNICRTAAVAGLMVVLSACSSQNETPQETKLAETTASETETVEAAKGRELLKKVEAAEDEATLIDKYGQVVYRCTNHYADGSQEEIYLYRSKELVACKTSYVELYDECGDVYGIDHEDETMFTYLFVGDGYKRFVDDEEGPIAFEYDEAEKVERCEEKDGIVTIQTKVEDISYFEPVLAWCGVDPGTIEYGKTTYELDADNYELFNSEVIFVTKEGEEIPVQKYVFEYDPEIPSEGEALKEKIAQGDQKEIKVIVDQGTSKEKIYSKKMAKDCLCVFGFGDDIEEGVYLDPEYTELYTGDTDLTQDRIFYMKSVE